MSTSGSRPQVAHGCFGNRVHGGVLTGVQPQRAAPGGGRLGGLFGHYTDARARSVARVPRKARVACAGRRAAGEEPVGADLRG